jgi:hypothetical protein
MGGLGELEQRVLDGDPRAMRALLRQASGPNIIDLPFRETEIRAKPDGTGGDRLLFTGYASVYEEPFEMADWLGPFTEIVRQGAAAKTLSASPDVIFCVNHDWNAVPMARTTKADTLRVSEDSTGLPVEADLDGTRADVHQVRSAMDAGELDAMSMAFYVTRQTWSPDYDQRDILEIDLDGGDTSVVTWPANPATTGTTALRSIQAQALLRTKVPGLILARAREERKGAKLSAATLETLQAVYDLISDAGEAASAAGPLLAELLGTDSSDDDTSSETDSAAPVGMSLARLRLREDARRLSA